MRWFELREFDDPGYPPLVLLKRLERRGVPVAPTFWASQKDEHSPPWDLSPWPLAIHGLSPAAATPAEKDVIVGIAGNPGHFSGVFDTIRRSVPGGVVFVQSAFDGKMRESFVFRHGAEIPAPFRPFAENLRRAVPSDVASVRLVYVTQSSGPLVIDARPIDDL